jgi:hypothetical protein
LMFPILVDPIIEGQAWIGNHQLTRRIGPALAGYQDGLVLFGGTDALNSRS